MLVKVDRQFSPLSEICHCALMVTFFHQSVSYFTFVLVKVDRQFSPLSGICHCARTNVDFVFISL